MYDKLKESCISNLESKKNIRKGRYHFVCQTNCYSEDNSSERCSLCYQHLSLKGDSFEIHTSRA